MNIVFATHGLDFDGDTLATKSLGGSETAVAYMSREFAKLGHRVMVFCKCSKPGLYDGVQYCAIESYVQKCRNLTIDVQVVSRFGEIWNPEVDAALNVFWMHDMPKSKGNTMMFSLKADLVALLSDYHIKCYRDTGAQIDDLIWQTKNGVDLQAVSSAEPIPRAKHPRFLYSSLPERGLERLLTNIWPLIKARIPDAELLIAGYDLASVSGMIADEMKQMQANLIRRAASTSGVKLIGSLTKSQLYSVMKGCTAHLYPVTFPEIFCITAVEAQACGLPIITTDGFALKETVGPKSGILVQPDDTYDQQFADYAVSIAQDKDFRSKLADAGPKFVREKGFTWAAIAKDWETKFERIFRERITTEPDRVISSMMRAGDIYQASQMSKDRDPQSPIPALLNGPDDKLSSKVLNEVDRSVVCDLVGGLWKMVQPDLKGKMILDASDTGKLLEAWVVRENMGATVLYQPKDDPNVKYDAVFVGDLPSFSSTPDLVISAYQDYLKPTGIVLTATPRGRITYHEDKLEALWSLTDDDLRHIGQNMNFGATFAQLYTGERGEQLGYWVSYFGADGEPERINLAARRKRFRPQQTLSVCMIAKDEEKWINMSLSYLREIADEIIVVDCESADRTAEFARQMGAEVITAKFEDFSQIRNIGLEAARGDWILCIDCDERLVNGDCLNKFLYFKLPESYTIKQHHLIVDGKRDHDTPARLFRNRPHYRFVGKIHEHCENTDVEEGQLSVAIGPTYDAYGVDIAHYGYVHEHVRRKKALLRNMDLLIEDARVNIPKGRMLTWALAMRDYLNAIKWHFRHVYSTKIDPGSFEHSLAESAIQTYFAVFGGRDKHLEKLVFPYYQEACSYLGINKLKYRPLDRVPFQIAIAMKGHNDLITNDDLKSIVPQGVWFIDPDEVHGFLDWNQRQLGRQMFGEYTPAQEAYDWKYEPKAPDPVQVLTMIREVYKRG